MRVALRSACKKLFNTDIELELSRPDEQFGDYATNVALKIAKQIGKNPKDVADSLAAELKDNSLLAGAPQVAGPGFINFTLSDKALTEALGSVTELAKPLKDKSVVIEYSDPNPFKILHVGHLYTSVVGDSIANLLQVQGANVHRVNFGGDVGLHVAKTMWAMFQELGGKNPDKLLEVDDKPQWMADNYVRGNNAYEDNPETKVEIEELNKQIYQIVETQDKTSAAAQIYWTTRGWSYEYFDEFYARIGVKFEKYYPESETVAPGMALVKQNMGKVFESSDGAVVFKGEVHNLHTRVFINSQGLPTYETKDVGVTILKDKDYHFDSSIIITGNEIYEYMQVVLKAIEQIKPELAAKTRHLTHGMVKLPGSEKMSSRKGNIIRAEAIIEMAKKANLEINQKENYQVALGAVKYAFLKQRLGADIIYDPAEAVSIEGNSGPYLQYAHARAQSILQKAGDTGADTGNDNNFDPSERSLARKISEYPEVVAKATEELMPHHICTYLYELAQSFNRFYEKSRIIGDKREASRLKLVRTYAEVLKSGLKILNITAPDKM